MKRVAILGSTGSIGVNALDCLTALRGEFTVTALSAGSNFELLARQAAKFRPKAVSIGSSDLAGRLKRLVPRGTRVLCGQDGLDEIVSAGYVDIVVFAVSGSSCVGTLLKAIDHEKRIALANKESLVTAGSLVMRKARSKKARIIPIDSEHSAIFQCLDGRKDFLKKIYLTGSGGPLLDVPAGRFGTLSRKFVLSHPRWKMGRKISVDSATMMNKGLEIIEARWLFDVRGKDIDVLIHPEAIVHSMVEFMDGAVLAQMGTPDMRVPIQYALTYPSRMASRAESVRFDRIGSLTFRKPDLAKFPCLGLACRALADGGTAPAVLNAADEEAVGLFLEGRIGFLSIPRVIEKALARHKNSKGAEPTLAEISNADHWARNEVRSVCCH